MKKNIAILGSTGSIGKSLIQILSKKKKNFTIVLLTAKKSHKELLLQAKKFKVANLIITDNKSFKKLTDNTKNTNIKVFNNFNCFYKVFKKKIDYTMNSISGVDGLEPTLKIIKHTRIIAISNKESIICGWKLIEKELKKNKVKFIPVDSEHFSLWYGLHGLNKNIEKIYLTASGGPFYLNAPKDFSKIKTSEALNHPNWKMGKKISIDSATLINKVYEVIEARNIFNIDYKKIEILMHPKSYVHAILKFNNGLTKIIAHDTTMKIPIFNTLFFNNNNEINSKEVDFDLLNNLNFKKPNPKVFPMIKILNFLPNKHSLYETVIVSANDKLVELFLEKKIKFIDIQKKLFKILLNKELIKFKQKYPKTFVDIIKLNNYVRLKIEQKEL